MEGGMRQSRTSSRYTSSPSPAVFNGPVRKWKKQWVATSAAPSIFINRNCSPSPPILLCRWTPLSSPSADQTPTHRFRYAPVVPIEKGKRKTQENVSNETSTRDQSNNGGHMIRTDSDSMLENPSSGGDTPPDEEHEEPSEDHAVDSNKSEGHGHSCEKKRKVGTIGEAKMPF